MKSDKRDRQTYSFTETERGVSLVLESTFT